MSEPEKNRGPYDLLRQELWRPLLERADRVPHGRKLLAGAVVVIVGLTAFVELGGWEWASQLTHEGRAGQPPLDSPSLFEIHDQRRSLRGRWAEAKAYEDSLIGRRGSWTGFVGTVSINRGSIAVHLNSTRLGANLNDGAYVRFDDDLSERLLALRENDEIEVHGEIESISAGGMITLEADSFRLVESATKTVIEEWREAIREDQKEKGRDGPSPVDHDPHDEDWSHEGLAARRDLRSGLRHVSPAEDGILVAEVAKGTFFFAHRSLWEDSEGVTVQRFPIGSLSFEVHKTPDGLLYALGFVNADAHRAIARDDKVHARMTVYSDYWMEATHAVRVLIESGHGTTRYVRHDSGQVTAADLDPRAGE